MGFYLLQTARQGIALNPIMITLQRAAVTAVILSGWFHSAFIKNIMSVTFS